MVPAHEAPIPSLVFRPHAAKVIPHDQFDDFDADDVLDLLLGEGGTNLSMMPEKRNYQSVYSIQTQLRRASV